MGKLYWVTPLGTIANLPIGLYSTVQLQTVDTTNNGALVTYAVISGTLPTGMALSSAGVISGTPEYSTPSNNSFSTINYNFIVRAASNGMTIDGEFNIIITNSVNTDFNWITPGGVLGTVANGEFYQLPLQVSSPIIGDIITYSFVSGELPPGMQVVPAGYLQGVPTLTSSIKVDTTQEFRFTIRAKNSQNQVRDQAFSIIVTNVYGPIIQPTTTNLGSYFDGSYYNQQLTVVEPNPEVVIEWSYTGTLPPGVTLDDTGLLSGYIQPMVAFSDNGPAGYDAGIDSSNIVAAGSLIPGIIYQIRSVGTTNFTEVGAKDNVVNATFAASASGTGTGTASVYNAVVSVRDIVVGQKYRIHTVGTTDFTSIGATANTIGLVFTATIAGNGTGLASQYISSSNPDELQLYARGPYDFESLTQNISYSFTIRAYDGANYELQNYIIDVVSRRGYTADNTYITADNTYLLVDQTNAYIPILLNTSRTLPTARAGSYYAFKFEGFDFQNDTLTYFLSNNVGTFDAYVPGVDAGFDYGGAGPDGTSSSEDDPGFPRSGVPFDSYKGGVGTNNLPGLLLDEQSGWLYGKLNPQSAAYQIYSFGVQVSKTRDGVEYTSDPIFFKLPVLGDINNIVRWVTPSNLGTIDNGSVSEIVLQANSVEDKPLTYTLVDEAGISIRLPQGLQLITDTEHDLGLLSGRVTFEAFSLDDYATTFDNDSMTIDREYTFTVKAETTDGTASAVEVFTLRLNIIDAKPYDNLYLQAMPSLDQRQIFNNIMNDPEIFVPEYIYRPTDPWFGLADNIEMLFLPGLTPAELDTYAAAMAHNHFTKTYTFDGIATAVVLDDNYNVKYEVVYINIVDPELNSDGEGAPASINLNGVIANPYIDQDGNTYKIVYPNDSVNMKNRLVSGVGYYDQSSLPKWMTSNQPDPTSPNKFRPPLGFVRAVVLAYTKPVAGKPIGYSSNLIAYRLNNSGINFNRIAFTVDRYLLDDFYSTNFNIAENKYQIGRETTFDALPNLNIGDIVATVNYAVTIPFNQINGRPVAYINSRGGIDGTITYKDGETLIFAKQEGFANPGPYNGWARYSDAFIGDDVTTDTIEGYDVISFDTYDVVPGFLEKAQGIAPVNERGGIWQINIVNGVVTLLPIQEIEVNQRVRVLNGSSYSGSIMYYNQMLNPGQTVPFYSVVTLQSNAITVRTTFNGDSTRFFSYRDEYYTPGENDKYVKFPQYCTFV